ncbi:hypothetical protein AHAS_Ahas16G0221200 [Arachis hypogaea]
MQSGPAGAKVKFLEIVVSDMKIKDVDLDWRWANSSSNTYSAKSGVNMSNGNVGFDWCLCNNSGDWVMECAGQIKGGSVIKNELWSLWKGLHYATRKGFKLVVCESDCP